jgi:hypothetical protein
VSSTDYDSIFLGTARALGGTFIGGDTNGTSISAGVSMNRTMFPVPSGRLVIFEVALAVEYDNDDGDIVADFESGNFMIGCPVVVFSILNSPPELMA